MSMRKLAGLLGLWLAAIFATGALAQPAEPYERRYFNQGELDSILAPIALYPDALLSQILMAATYPEDVYEAAAWSRDNGRLRGQEAVRQVQSRPWDPSVISLVAFPQVLAMMDERRAWTEDLGDAFILQPDQVMETVQELRRRADAAGNLRTTDEIVVRRTGRDYVIEPPLAEEVYVPYYDPRVVYGDWWWPDYEPVYWNPWPGYSFGPSYYGFGWGPSIAIGSGFFFGSIDWRHRDLRYSHHRPWYFHGRDYFRGHRWRHDHNPRWRHRDGHHGRHGLGRGRDGHWRGHEGRWRDRDGDGHHRDRDGRHRDRDGRHRDHDHGGHDGRPRGATQVIRPDARPDSPTYVPTMPQLRAPAAEPRVVAPQPRAVHPMHRPPPQAAHPMHRAPASVPRVAPVQRPVAPTPAPQPRAALPAPQPRVVAPPPGPSHPMSRPAPATPVPSGNPMSRSAPTQVGDGGN